METVSKKKMTKAALIGAVVGIPMPFIGPVIGAIAGAGYVYYRSKSPARS